MVLQEYKEASQTFDPTEQKKEWIGKQNKHTSKPNQTKNTTTITTNKNAKTQTKSEYYEEII